jgi:hypothetical protein
MDGPFGVRVFERIRFLFLISKNLNLGHSKLIWKISDSKWKY